MSSHVDSKALSKGAVFRIPYLDWFWLSAPPTRTMQRVFVRMWVST